MLFRSCLLDRPFLTLPPSLALSLSPLPPRSYLAHYDLVAARADGAGAPVRVGGTLPPQPLGVNVTLTATVTPPARAAGRAAFVLVLVRNNEATLSAAVGGGGPFSANWSVPLPDAGVDRWRAELHDASSDQIASMTNHVFLASAQPQA